MAFDDNPADDRYELDQCVDEIKRLQAEVARLTAERDEANGRAERLAVNLVEANQRADEERERCVAMLKKRAEDFRQAVAVYCQRDAKMACKKTADELTSLADAIARGEVSEGDGDGNV